MPCAASGHTALKGRSDRMNGLTMAKTMRSAVLWPVTADSWDKCVDITAITVNPTDGGRKFLRNVGSLTIQHGVTFHNTATFGTG
jgi:hypothetical protein